MTLASGSVSSRPTLCERLKSLGRKQDKPSKKLLPKVTTPVESLEEKLERTKNEHTHTQLRGQEYASRQEYEQLITHSFILWTARDNAQELERLHKEILEHPKIPEEYNTMTTCIEEVFAAPYVLVFGILYSLNSQSLIHYFVREEMSDSLLPMSKGDLSKMGFGTKFRCLFHTQQYRFLVQPLVEGTHTGYDDDEILPFERMKQIGNASESSIVWSARNRLDKSELWAVKETRDIDRMLREVKLMKKTNGKHFTKCYASLEQDGLGSMVIAPLADCNLRTQLFHKQTPDDLLFDWILCLSSALRALYSDGLRHTNIKLKNILIKDQQVYISDFGTARFISSTPTAHVGNYEYGAPEQFSTGILTYIGRSCDVFSMGAVFLDILTTACGKSARVFRQARGRDRKEPTNSLGVHMRTDFSFRNHASVVEEWIQQLTLQVQDGRKKALVELLLSMVRQMLLHNSDDRPKPKTINKKFSIALHEYSDRQWHCECRSKPKRTNKDDSDSDSESGFSDDEYI